MHTFAHHHHGETGEAQAGSTRGLVMNLGWRYDLLVWFFDTFVLHGKLRQLRQRTADLAQLQPGEAGLGGGGGTRAPAMVACKRVGTTGPRWRLEPRSSQNARARPHTDRRSLPLHV